MPESYVSQSTEAALIDEILHGNADAYRSFVERYHVGLIRHLTHLLGDQMAAEDVAQDAFLRAYDRLDRFDGEHSFSTWLYKIAGNMAFDALRARRPAADYDALSESMASDLTLPDQASEEALRAEAVQTALAKLEPQQREVVSLYYWQGLTYEQIASMTGRPVGTVRTWLYRAKQQLRKELHTYGPAE